MIDTRHPTAYSTGAMKLSVIIVSFNTAPLLRACLTSVFESSVGFDLEVIVVDNASSDDSLRMVERDFPSVRLIANPRNVGFAAANNQALRITSGDFALLLNSDCEALPGALQSLVEFARTHPQSGVVAPKLLNPDGSVQPSGRRFPTLWRFFMEVTALYKTFHPHGYFNPREDYTRIREVDEVSGAAMLVRRETFEQVGLLDEGFFFYWEDIDWCKRIKAAGWKVVYLPQARIVHHFGGSSGAFRPLTHRASLRSMHHYFRKHHGAVTALLVKTTLVLREAVHLLLATITLRRERLRLRMDALREAVHL